jgi:hypothetical protein
LDSLEWSKTFDILSISRLSLHAAGIPSPLVASLTDQEMQTIADTVREALLIEPIAKIVELLARLYLAERRHT